MLCLPGHQIGFPDWVQLPLVIHDRDVSSSSLDPTWVVDSFFFVPDYIVEFSPLWSTMHTMAQSSGKTLTPAARLEGRSSKNFVGGKASCRRFDGELD